MGFEHPTFRLQGERSNQLRHHRGDSNGLQINCDFHNSQAREYCAWAWQYYSFREIQYLSQNLLAYSQSWIKQTKNVVMMTKEGSTKIVNFTAFEARVLALLRGHISKDIAHKTHKY